MRNRRATPVQHRRRHDAVHAQTLAGVPQQVHLYCEAQAVRTAAALTNQRQIVAGERLVPNQVVCSSWQRPAGYRARPRKELIDGA